MSVQFSDLVWIAGITLLITLLWAATVAFTYWDIHRWRLTGGKVYVWLALVALLPFVGFIIYIFFRALSPILSPRINGMTLKTRRETALKQPSARRSPMPTLLASDLAIQIDPDPKKAVHTNVNRRKVPAKYVFTVSSGADQGKEFIVEDLPAKIGRGSEESICLDRDLGVSRKHAEIYEQGGILRIRDLKSTHGTQINGILIEDTSLEPGDRIQVGLTELVVKVIKE